MSVRNGQRRTGGQRDGLFEWTPQGLVPGLARDNPRRRECPTCLARIAAPCRRTGGQAMTGYHETRKVPE